MKRITILAAWLNLLFTGLATAQTTITVRQDGSGDYTTIQAAIDAAASGDTIAVYSGTYIENIYFYRKYRITLRSTDPTSPAVVAATIIDGNRAGPVVLSVDPDTTGCVLSGFTIRNGSAREEGGGIQGWAWFTYQTHAVIENNVITGNAAHCGGGLFGFNGTIQNNTITRNSAARDGGALNRCYGTIQNNTITSNSAARSGGALETCHGTVQNNVVVGNSAGLDGGGLAVCSGTIRNNVIVGNSARSSGGGFASCWGAIQNNTIVGNSARDHGGALCACGGIANCIVRSNRTLYSSAQIEMCATPSCSCIEGWTGSGEGNISDDPLFVTGPLGDYYLSQTAAGQAVQSPCVDAGSDTALELYLADRTTRTDGQPDVGVVDMGYHYPTALPPPEPMIAASPTAFALTVDEGTNPATQTLEIWNSGSGTLTYDVTPSPDLHVEIGPPGLSIDVVPSSGQSSGEVNTHHVSFDTLNLSPGTYTKDIVITGNAANSPVPVPVEVTITPTVQRGFTVIAPNGGETWQIGTTQQIRWIINEPNSSAIKIQMMRGVPGDWNASVWITTYDWIPATATSYDWYIDPGLYVAGNDYWLNVARMIGDPAYWQDWSDGNFSLYVTVDPNLALANCDFAPVAPVQLQPGDPLVLGAFVENNGMARAGPFWLEFWGSRTGGLTLDLFLADSVVLGPLDGGGAIPFAAEKALYNVPDGRYTVVIAADRPDQVPESNERDNRGVVAGKRLLVFRPPGAADLAVAQIQGFSFGPNPAYNGQAIQLGSQVENIGTVDTGRFWIEFWGSYNRIDPQLDFFLCDSIFVDNLAAGQSVNLSEHARTLYDCPTGVFMVGVYVDRLGRVNEADETNNYVFLDGIALNQPLPAPVVRLAGPDLVIASADFEPSAPAVVGPDTPLNIQARIENRGTAASEPFWVEFWGAKLGGLCIQELLVDSERVAAMPAGGWIDLGLERPLYSIPDGPYTVTVLVDRPNQVAETDEKNNRLAVAGKRLLTMRPDTAANLVAEDFIVSPTLLAPGEPITLGGRVRNGGAEDSGPFWIEFWGSHDMDYPDLGFFLCDSVFVANLAPGAAVDLSTYQQYLYANLPPGDCALVCFADRTDLVNETNEADNYSILREYTVEPAANEITIMLPGNVPLVMVRVPAGSFQMGSPSTERSRYSDEEPTHTVNIAYDFYMGKYELTQRQWLALMGSWPGSSPTSNYGLGDDYPAYYISWNDCQNFITALNTHVSNTSQGPATFRLPSEAEWEYACRAGTQTRFFFGDSLSVRDYDTDGLAGTLPGNRSDYMWWWFNCQGDANGAYGSKPVGTKLPNQFGLYNMSGNVWEWCQDWYHSSYTGAPTDGSAWETSAGTHRVCRGGSWYVNANVCRSANRSHASPDLRSFLLGLRLARTP